MGKDSRHSSQKASPIHSKVLIEVYIWQLVAKQDYQIKTWKHLDAAECHGHLRPLMFCNEILRVVQNSPEAAQRLERRAR